MIQKFTLYEKKWNFIDNFKLSDFREALNDAANVVSHKSFDFSNIFLYTKRLSYLYIALR